MEFFAEYGLFLLETLTIVLAVIVVIAVSSKISGGGDEPKGAIRITDLSEKLADQAKQVSTAVNAALTEEKASLRERLKKRFNRSSRDTSKKTEKKEKVAVVIEFKGDMKASQVANLREEVSAILAMERKPDLVVLKLTSPGGLVHTYGLASSQLSRLRDANITLCACVDTVAASGGYMMAVCADRIISAPFAVLGSIGVVAQIPNIHRFLKNRDIDVELHTAGANKRTLTLLGENTPEGRRKFKEDLEQTHALFKSWIAERRPELDLDAVADGSIFYGTDALAKGLCDEIATSDDLLMNLNVDHHLFVLKWVEKKTLAARLGRDASAAVVDQVDNYINRTNQDYTRL
jgi:serine protease SohB